MGSLKTWLPAVAFVVLVPVWRGLVDSYDRKTISQPPPVHHLITPPSGFVDVMVPDTPGAKYYEGVKALWKQAGIKEDPYVISALFLASDLEKHNGGEGTPTDNRYYVISFKYFQNPKQSLEVTKQGISKLTGPDFQSMADKQNPELPMKVGEFEQHRVVRDWDTGFISSTVIPFQSRSGATQAAWKKLVLTCFLTHPRGIYTISSINRIKGSNSQNGLVEELEHFAKSIQEVNMAR